MHIPNSAEIVEPPPFPQTDGPVHIYKNKATTKDPFRGWSGMNLPLYLDRNLPGSRAVKLAEEDFLPCTENKASIFN